MNRRVVVGGVLALGLAGWWFFSSSGVAPETSGAPGSVQPALPASAAAVRGSSPGQPAQASGALFAVRVVAEGKPVSGARVRASRPGNPAPAWDKSPEVKTDAEGRADVPVEPGEWVLTAQHEAWATRLVDVSKPRDELRTEVTLQLERGVQLHGRALDESGQPVVPATIRAVPLGERLPRRRTAPEGVVEVPVDTKGEFSFSHLAAGWWLIDGVAEGSGKAGPQRLLLPTPERVTLTFRRSGFLEGTVVMSGGGVAPGAQVTLIGPEGTEALTASATGTFSAELQPGSYRVRAKHAGQVGSAESVLIRGGQTRATRVVLGGTGGALRGVVTAASAPVERAMIVVSPHNEDGTLATALSDREGKWRLEGLPPATYDVEVLTRRYQPGELRGISVTEGAEVELDVQLEALGGVRGVVVDEADRPVAARVWLRMFARQEQRQVQTGPDGRFEFLDVRPARGSVMAARTDHEQGTGTVLSIKPGVIAEVKLVAHGAQPVEVKIDRSRCTQTGDVGLWIAERASGTRARTWTVPAAQSSLTVNLSPGEWTVAPWVDPRGGCESERTHKVTVVAGTPTPPLQVVLRPRDDSGKLVVTVLEADGQPSAQAQVTVRDARGSLFSSNTEPDGTVRLEPMDNMSVVATNLGRAARAENVPATQRALTLTLAPPARLQLRLEGTSGVTLVKVEQAGGLGEDEFRVSSPDVVLEEQPAGSLLVTATDATHTRLGKTRVVTRPGEVARATVRLEQAALLRGHVTLPPGANTPSFVVLSRGDEKVDTILEPDGSFALPPVQPGAWSLQVFCGHACGKESGQELTLPPGPTDVSLP